MDFNNIITYLACIFFLFIFGRIFIIPIKTIFKIIINSVLGGIIIANAIIKMIYFPNYTPVGSIVCGLFLMIFADLLIKFLYTIAMIFIMMYGIAKISKFIYSIKNKK